MILWDLQLHSHQNRRWRMLHNRQSKQVVMELIEDDGRYCGLVTSATYAQFSDLDD